MSSLLSETLVPHHAVELLVDFSVLFLEPVRLGQNKCLELFEVNIFFPEESEFYFLVILSVLRDFDKSFDAEKLTFLHDVVDIGPYSFCSVQDPLHFVSAIPKFAIFAIFEALLYLVDCSLGLVLIPFIKASFDHCFEHLQQPIGCLESLVFDPLDVLNVSQDNFKPVNTPINVAIALHKVVFAPILILWLVAQQ